MLELPPSQGRACITLKRALISSKLAFISSAQVSPLQCGVHGCDGPRYLLVGREDCVPHVPCACLQQGVHRSRACSDSSELPVLSSAQVWVRSITCDGLKLQSPAVLCCAHESCDNVEPRRPFVRQGTGRSNNTSRAIRVRQRWAKIMCSGAYAPM